MAFSGARINIFGDGNVSEPNVERFLMIDPSRKVSSLSIQDQIEIIELRIAGIISFMEDGIDGISLQRPEEQIFALNLEIADLRAQIKNPNPGVTIQ